MPSGDLHLSKDDAADFIDERLRDELANTVPGQCGAVEERMDEFLAHEPALSLKDLEPWLLLRAWNCGKLQPTEHQKIADIYDAWSRFGAGQHGA